MIQRKVVTTSENYDNILNIEYRDKKEKIESEENNL